LQNQFWTMEDVVSPAERFARHSKLQTDKAISHAYSRLTAHSVPRAIFTELLAVVRERSRQLLMLPMANGHHPGIEAIFNLSRFADAHVRSIAQWSGSQASWQGAISALAQHLVGKYPVPRFLGAAWYATDGTSSERARRWFIAHASGVPFRSLDLPLRMTRKMEHIFLGSPDHLGIECAMRRAELLGLGADDELVRAVLTTRLGADLSNGEFWRTVWLFLIENSQAIDAAQVGPIIDFVHAVRHERVAVETTEGIVMREPPRPSFSVRGRTPQSILRLMQDWHRGLGLVSGEVSWLPSGLRPMVVEEPSQESSAPPVSWHMTELTNNAQLRAEGAALHHCVASYGNRCSRGASHIWSLRVKRGSTVRSILTVEVDTDKHAVIQARGFRNRRASGKPLRVLGAWAARENLRLTL
jgi:PcfJ-like protein